MPIQTEDPSLDIAFWNQTGNLFMLNIDALLSTILQGPIKLSASILNGMSVCIDYYDECSLGVTAAVHVDLLDKGFPHPTLGVALA